MFGSLEGGRFWCLVFGLCTYPFSPPPQTEKLKTVHEWSFLEFEYDSPEARQADLTSGNWQRNIPFLIDVDVHYNKTNDERTVFVTVPKVRDGTPASLAKVVVNENGIPYLKPYPSWAWHREPSRCKTKRILSSFRMMIDDCDRLWVLDTGKVNVLAGIICPPQILAFNLKTDKLIHRYEIPQSQYSQNSQFVTVVVEVLSKDNKCQNTFLYLADVSTYAILVYDVANKRSWRIQHLSMLPDPNFLLQKVDDDLALELDGVSGMSLSTSTSVNDNALFYHPMSGETESWVFTKHLRNESLAINPLFHPVMFHTYIGRRGTQSLSEAIDADGIMYFGMLSDITINCFNTRGEYGKFSPNTDVIASNRDTLQFPSGVKVINTPSGEQELWIATSRVLDTAHIISELKETSVNFRIMYANVQDMKRGTRCENPPIPNIFYEYAIL